MVNMIKPCPYCGQTPEEIEWVEIVDEFVPMDVVMADDDPPSMSMDLPETTKCRRYQPCGHAFTTDSLKTVVDELKQLQHLQRELQTTEDMDRLKELKEYAIPAQKNAVQNAKGDVERAEEAEELEL